MEVLVLSLFPYAYCQCQLFDFRYQWLICLQVLNVVISFVWETLIFILYSFPKRIVLKGDVCIGNVAGQLCHLYPDQSKMFQDCAVLSVFPSFLTCWFSLVLISKFVCFLVFFFCYVLLLSILCFSVLCVSILSFISKNSSLTICVQQLFFVFPSRLCWEMFKFLIVIFCVVCYLHIWEF